MIAMSSGLFTIDALDTSTYSKLKIDRGIDRAIDKSNYWQIGRVIDR